MSQERVTGLWVLGDLPAGRQGRMLYDEMVMMSPIVSGCAGMTKGSDKEGHKQKGRAVPCRTARPFVINRRSGGRDQCLMSRHTF